MCNLLPGLVPTVGGGGESLAVQPPLSWHLTLEVNGGMGEGGQAGGTSSSGGR